MNGYILASVFLLPSRSSMLGALSIAPGGVRFVGCEIVFGRTGGLLVFGGVLLFVTLPFLTDGQARIRPRSATLMGCAIVLLVLPALIGFTYAAIYLWSSAMAFVAIPSLRRTGGLELSIPSQVSVLSSHSQTFHDSRKRSLSLRVKNSIQDFRGAIK